MEMVAYERQKKLLEMIDQDEFVKLNDMKKALDGVSESTIKRDLKVMAEKGQIELVRGGAAKTTGQPGRASLDLPIDEKSRLYTEQKERIARFAATLVQDGDTIFIDSSTTATPLVRYLGSRSVTIVTSSITILQNTLEDNLNIILLGGEYNRQTGSVVGALTETMLSTLFFDKAFIGANGFSEIGGITTPDFRESAKKQIVCRNSKIAYFLMDSSKAGNTTLSKCLDLGEANLITDDKNDLLEKFKSYYIAP